MTPEDLQLPGHRVEAAGTGLAAQREPVAFSNTPEWNEHLTLAVQGSPIAREGFCFLWSSALKQTLHFPINIGFHMSDTFIACLSSIKMLTSPKDPVLSSFHPISLLLDVSTHTTIFVFYVTRIWMTLHGSCSWASEKAPSDIATVSVCLQVAEIRYHGI